ncbi:periplasmic solute binding protein, partial [Pseudomonas syringae pv. pisi str. 1704B]
GKLDPDNAKNLHRQRPRLRQAPAPDARRCARQTDQGTQRRPALATVHAAYDYLLREFGLEVTAVVEP